MTTGATQQNKIQQSERAGLPLPIDYTIFGAALFDLDGVLTDTASLHAACWKQVFDDLLERLARQRGETFAPFAIDSDYRRYVDGKARADGVRDFLISRGIRLPETQQRAAAPAQDSVLTISQRKDACFSAALGEQGVEVYQGSIDWLRQLRRAGLKLAVVSASHHCAEVLRAAGIADLFDARVDGQVADQLKLAGKPAADTFLEGARRLAIEPARAIVIEDAIAGVRAGHSGGFGLVVGVARHANRGELLAAGASIVVNDLAELVA